MPTRELSDVVVPNRLPSTLPNRLLTTLTERAPQRSPLVRLLPVEVVPPRLEEATELLVPIPHEANERVTKVRLKRRTILFFIFICDYLIC